MNSTVRSRGLWPNRVTWIVGLGSTAALAGQSGSPWMVNALTTSAHFTVQNAGLMVTAEMLAMGGTMIAVASSIHRISAKPAAAAALVGMIAAQVLSAAASSLASMTAARVIAGVSFGMLFALASAFGARSTNPARTYATAGVVALLIGTTINPLLGFGLQDYGHRGVFGGLAIYIAVIGVVLMLVRFPGAPIEGSADRDSGGSVSTVATVAVMTVMALLAVATNGVFVFLTTIAAQVGLKGGGLGAGMSVVSLVSALGGVAAARLGNSRGLLAPLVVGLVVMGATLYGLTIVRTQVQFWLTFTALVTTYWFLWPYIFGLAVAVDPKGRVAAATGSAKILAGGLGSGISGVVVERYGLSTFGLIAAALCVAALGVAVAMARVGSGAKRPKRPVPA